MFLSRDSSRAAGCWAIAMAATALAAAATPPTPFRQSLTSCHLRGLGQPALCGEYEVWEDRAGATGRRIALKVVVLPARASEPEPDPLFLFAGGPGQSITRVGPMIARALNEVRRERDMVLIDQRGTGGSHALSCPDDATQTLAQTLEVDTIDAAELGKCLAELDADPTQYTTANAVDDFDEVRTALGYDRINLWGASYGTRAALVYLRRHPESVRSLILDSVAPTTMPLPLFMARDAERSMQLLFAGCAADPACAERYPTLAADLAEVLASLEAAPATAVVRHPRTGVASEVTIRRDAFAGGLRGLLYSSDTASLIPLLVQQAKNGHYHGFAAAMSSFGESVSDSMTPGLMLSVLCAEDVHRVSPEAGQEQAAATFLGGLTVRTFHEACKVWPHAMVTDGFAEPVESATPALVLSGELDPVTPPEWGEQTAGHLRNSRHVVVPGTGHGVTTVGCVPKLIRNFLESADPKNIDPACAERQRRAPYFLDFAGPTP